MLTVVKISKELHDWLKAEALQKGIKEGRFVSMTEIVEDACSQLRERAGAKT